MTRQPTLIGGAVTCLPAGPLLSMKLTRLVVLGLVVSASVALANPAAGVSDERVVLPGAPGSVDGVGENASVEGNQGSMRYRVAVEVPRGFPGLTPQVEFNYSSTNGSGHLGMGWSMPSWSIERMTSKGLQKYDLTDRFAVDGSDELVKVSESGADAVYRARFESGFVRWTWKNRGTGEDGYWTAEYPDGRVGTFGADAQGMAVTSAQVRVPTTSKVWRWHLTQIADQYGHVMRLSWTKDASGHPLIERIDYVYEGAAPRHSVRFTWEGRNDVVSNGTPGFELRLTQRLKDVRIFSGTTNAELVRAYVLNYEADGMSGGASRLANISRFGRGMVQYPVTFRFGYSKTLGGACDASCEKPFVKNMGTLAGVDFSTGRATLIDMNGDALPDVVASDAQGRHSIYTAKLDAEGRTSFNMTATPSSQTTGSSAFIIGDARVQVIDVNGDGFVDITQAKVPAVLCNNGSGDWVPSSFCVGSSAPGLPSAFTPEEDADQTQADPKYVRFFDYDNDRRIDWLRTQAGGSGTEVLVNSPTGFNTVTVQNIGAVFDEGPLQLADMNGDGLQDPVQLIASGMAVQVQYKLNYGWGTWSPNWSTITLTGLDASQASIAELQDINGDGLADVVAVSGNEVRIALNRNGDRFDNVMVINDASLATGSAVPVRGSNTVVAYADMNGNGSDDIVWIQSNGLVQYLELFPIRPNLIARIDNGIGAVQLISYGTSIVEQGRDAAANMPWANRVPNAYSMVKRLESFVTLTGSDTAGLKEIISYRYHSGFYDGNEKQFRGYEQVERELLSDMSRDAQEPGLMVDDYDVGKTDPTLASTRVRGRVYAGMGSNLALLTETSWLYERCQLADIPVTTPAITFSCMRSSTMTSVERDVANAVTTRTEYDYDGYGNVSTERELGVIHFGTTQQPRPCDACTQSGAFGKPCGAMCTGDERYTVREYYAPGASTGGKWFVGKQVRVSEGAVNMTGVSETQFFYDGNDFEGAASGLTKGFVSRATHRTGPGANDLVSERFRADTHGNLVERIEPAGAVANGATQRRLATFDAAGLNILTTEVRTGGNPVTALRRDYVWDPSWEQVVQSSNWYPIVNGMAAGTQLQTRTRYDDHNRTIRVLEQGDTDANPSQEFVYELGDPSSRFLIQTRSSATSGLDIIEARCLDGKGRMYQTRTKLDGTNWQVSGFTEFDARGVPVRRFQPYTASTGTCETMPPTGVPFTRYTFDPLGRQLTEVEPDGALRKTEYGPLVLRRFDENDADMASPFFNTPTIEEFDGLNRLVAFQRMLTTSGPQPRTQISYDALGHISSVRDPAGNVKTQTWDALDRLVSVADPNAGTTRFEHDANGNIVRSVDARNKAVRFTYDGANRMVAMWDEADEAGSKVGWSYDLLMGCTDCTNAGAELVETKFPAGAERRGYDAKGNLRYLERSIDGVSFVTRRTFDGAEREISTTYPSGLEVRRVYDGANRIISIPNYVDAIEYDARGRTKKLKYTNGTATDYAYDQQLRLSSLKTTLKDGSPLVDLGYTRDKAGNLLTVVENTVRSARQGATITYDAWDRVKTMSLARDGEPELLTFAFDDIDNITSVTSSLGAGSKANLGAFTYVANKPNAVGKAGALELGYDERGNLSNRGALSFSRDAFNRLTKTEKDGTATATFTWGAGDERIKRTEGTSTTLYAEPNFEIRDGIGNLYVRLGDLRVARAQTAATASLVLSDLAPAAGSGSAKAVMGDRVIDIADAWMAKAAALNVVQLSGGPTPSPVTALLASASRRLLVDDVTWMHADHLRTVVASTDVNGGVRAEQSFYPFGETRNTTGFVDAYGFTGAEHVQGTGLLHAGARELDPTTGRWTSVDPLFLASTEDNIDDYGQSLGGYIYVGNNFANFSDPTGLIFGIGKNKSSSSPPAPKPPKTPKEKASTRKGVAKGIAIAAAALSALMSFGAAIATATAGDDDAGKEQAKVANSFAAASTGVAGVGTAVSSGLEIVRNRAKAKEKKAAKQQASSHGSASPPSNNAPPPNQPNPNPSTSSTQPVTSTATPPPNGVPNPSLSQSTVVPHPPSTPPPTRTPVSRTSSVNLP